LTHTLVNRAVQNGANSLAEGFLFAVAAALILGETWRSSRSQAKRRDKVDDMLEELEIKVKTLTEELKDIKTNVEDQIEEVRTKYVLFTPNFAQDG
jgi:optic atrophy 3 protein